MAYIVTTVLITAAGAFASLLLLVLLLAGTPNSTPHDAACMKAFMLVTAAGAGVGVIGSLTSLFMSHRPLALTFALVTLLTPILVFIAALEFSKMQADRSPPLGWTKLIVRGLVLLVFGGGGIVMYYVGAREFLHQRLLMRTSVPISAEIIESRVQTSTTSDTDSRLLRDNSTTSHLPIVKFRYAMNGRSYESDLLRPTVIVHSYASKESAEEELAPFPLGKNVTAYVSPELPEKAYLVPEKSAGPMVFLILGGVLPLIAMLAGKLI